MNTFPSIPKWASNKNYLWHSNPESRPICRTLFDKCVIRPKVNIAYEILKGERKGGAMISDKHANFIVNHGNAESSDVIYLIKKIKDKIFHKFNINLELEIKLVGFEQKILNELGYNES